MSRTRARLTARVLVPKWAKLDGVRIGDTSVRVR